MVARWRTEVPTPTDGGPSVDSASTPAPSDTPAAPVTNDTPPTTDTAPAPGSGDQLNAADASVRNSRPLTSDEFNTFSQQAQQMGMPADQIHQVQGPTAYGPTFDQLTIGPDVKPLPPDLRPPDLANPANAAMGPTEVLSHEIIGAPRGGTSGQEHSLPWAEEAQASFRAGLHGDLTPGAAAEPDPGWRFAVPLPGPREAWHGVHVHGSTSAAGWCARRRR